MKSSVQAIIVCAALVFGGVAARDGSTSRIVNGQNSTRGQFPYQALLLIETSVNGGMTLCGGCLISDTWVLTAAHCLHDAVRVNVHLGALHTHDHNEATRVRLQSDHFISHPSYFRPLTANDIALVQLPSRVRFNDFVRSIRLPWNWENVGNETVIASGFGMTATNGNIAPILQWIQLATMSNWQCIMAFRNRVSLQVLALNRRIVCAVDPRGNGSVCNGDSGGPLATENGILIGVASFGSNLGCGTGHPSAFVRVSTYLDWIQELTGIRD